MEIQPIPVLCMKGNVYTRQKCPVCSGIMRHDEDRQGVFCVNHPEIPATKQFYVKFPGGINRRFSAYQQAYRFLTGLRNETDKGAFDIRDHMASKPLGFANLAKGYLEFQDS